MSDGPITLRALVFVVNITDPSKREELLALEEEIAQVISDLEPVNSNLATARGAIRSVGTVMNESGDLTLKDILQTETIPFNPSEAELRNRQKYHSGEWSKLEAKNAALLNRKDELTRQRRELLREAIQHRLCRCVE